MLTFRRSTGLALAQNEARNPQLRVVDKRYLRASKRAIEELALVDTLPVIKAVKNPEVRMPETEFAVGNIPNFPIEDENLSPGRVLARKLLAAGALTSITYIAISTQKMAYLFLAAIIGLFFYSLKNIFETTELNKNEERMEKLLVPLLGAEALINSIMAYMQTNRVASSAASVFLACAAIASFLDSKREQKP